MSQGQGTISSNDLMRKLVTAKKVMDKVETGSFERGNINEDILRSAPEEISQYQPEMTTPMRSNAVPSVDRIQNSKLPDAIKKAMIENPIPQISLNDSIDMNFVKGAKRLMEQEGMISKKSNTTTQTTKTYLSEANTSDLVTKLTPIIENIIRKTLDDIVDKKLTQILTAQQTASINENLVLKVGDSIFKGKITGVNKSK
jgi:hypothetical protein